MYKTQTIYTLSYSHLQVSWQCLVGWNLNVLDYESLKTMICCWEVPNNFKIILSRVHLHMHPLLGLHKSLVCSIKCSPEFKGKIVIDKHPAFIPCYHVILVPTSSIYVVSMLIKILILYNEQNMNYLFPI